MGLLDFFSKGGNTNPQGTNVNPPTVPDFASIQQSYTNQSLANVSYPMASGNPYPVPAPAPAAAVAPVAPVNQVVPQYAEPMPAMAVTPEPVMPITQPVSYNQPVTTQPEEKDIPSYEYVDPSKHPVLPTVVPNQGHTQTMPEGIKVTTYEPSTNTAPEIPSVDSNSMPTPSTDSAIPEMSPMPQAAQPETALGAMPDINNMQPEPASFDPMANQTMPEVTPMQPEQPAEQPVSVADLPSMQIPQIPPMDQFVNTTSVGNAAMDLSNQLASMPSTDQLAPADVNLTQPVVPSAEPVAETAAPEPAVDVNNNGLEIGVGLDGSSGTDVSPTENATNAMEQVAEVTGPVAETTDIAPAAPEVETTTPEPMPVAPMEIEPAPLPVEEPKVAAVESTPTPTAFEMSYFKTVGFIGLNTNQTNLKVVEKISDLSGRLAEHAEVFILDSAKGYAKSIFDSAKQKQIELMGMFLKPFHSGYSDEADLGDYDNFTVMMFSNAADKIKNIIKESDILIMPEVVGLNNLGTLFDIWSTNSMYPGQNKPLLLIGKGWTNILTQLKSLFKLTDNDLSFVTVCQTTDEALTKITELDTAFITKEVKQPRKIIDLREEDDEEGLFV